MPCGAELAAAADVGEDVDSAALEPELAEGSGVGGRARDLEAAVCGEEGGVGAVVLEVFAVDDEVGDFGAVFGGGEELFDRVFRGVELGRGGVVAGLSVLVAASPRSSEDGVRKLVTLRKKLVVGVAGGFDGDRPGCRGRRVCGATRRRRCCGCRRRRGPARFREW